MTLASRADTDRANRQGGARRYHVGETAERERATLTAATAQQVRRLGGYLSGKSAVTAITNAASAQKVWRFRRVIRKVGQRLR